MKRASVIAICTAFLVAVPAGGALAGEVKGPPRQIDNADETGALDHAHSACAASGLNDYDSDEGQNARMVQTPSDAWNYYGFQKGDIGWLCNGRG